MSARDHRPEDVTCPVCGKTGTVQWSEDDGYIRDEPNRRADAPEGFHVIPGASRSTDTRIACSTCNVIVDK